MLNGCSREVALEQDTVSLFYQLKGLTYKGDVIGIIREAVLVCLLYRVGVPH